MTKRDIDLETEQQDFLNTTLEENTPKMVTKYCLTYLDEVILLGAIFVKQATGSCFGHKQDGLEGNLTLSGEVDVSQRIVAILLKNSDKNFYWLGLQIVLKSHTQHCSLM